MAISKPIHGESLPLWKKLELCEHPPEPCGFKLGDRVIFTNDQGVSFDCDIIGFASDASFQGRTIHFKQHGLSHEGAAWWFPARPDQMKPFPGDISCPKP